MDHTVDFINKNYDGRYLSSPFSQRCWQAKNSFFGYIGHTMDIENAWYFQISGTHIKRAAASMVKVSLHTKP